MRQIKRKIRHHLFKDDKRYAGMFVATPSFSDTTIVASGISIAKAISNAQKRGYEDPVITKIPKRNVIFLF